MAIVTEKYNRSYGRSFASQNAVQKYLGPVGLSLDEEPSLDFHENQTRFSVKEEQAVFKAIHFCRWHITNGKPHLRRKWERLHDALRSRAVNANMGLVFKCIEIHVKHRDFDDMSSAGRFALLRSVDGFNPWRGFRFSTYACMAILQALTREAQLSNGKFNYQSDAEPDNVLVHEEHEDGNEEIILRLKAILKNGVLSRREKSIIRDRFGIGRAESKTLGQVGEELKVSKERIRQIQIGAFKKLRAALDNACVTA